MITSGGQQQPKRSGGYFDTGIWIIWTSTVYPAPSEIDGLTLLPPTPLTPAVKMESNLKDPIIIDNNIGKAKTDNLVVRFENVSIKDSQMYFSVI